jgi:AraC family transcriptional regulator
MSSHAGEPHLTRAGRVLYPPGATFGPRPHPHWEFVWILSGSAVFTQGDDQIQLHPGMALLIRPGPPDTFRWDPRRSTQHGYIHFLQMSEMLDQPWPQTRRTSPHDPLLGMLEYIVWLRSVDSEWQVIGQPVLVLLLELFHASPMPAERRYEQLPDTLLRLADFVGGQWASNGMSVPSVSVLAHGARISAAQLARVCRAHVGLGPVGMLNRLRLMRAADMLAGGGLAVQEVSRLCGFANPYHFSRSFREVHGLPPRSYRDQLRTGLPPTSPVPDSLLEFARLVADAEVRANRRRP